MAYQLWHISYGTLVIVAHVYTIRTCATILAHVYTDVHTRVSTEVCNIGAAITAWATTV